MDSSAALTDYVTEKVTRVTEKYLKRAETAHVTFSVNKHRHIAEISIHAAHFDITAHESTEEMYSSIDLALDKIERQLRKHNKKLNHHKGRTSASASAATVHVDVISSDLEEENETPRVIETDNIPAKPLSLEDAVLQLEINHSDFLVFRDAATERINVIYKRRDGNYGLIDPNR